MPDTPDADGDASAAPAPDSTPVFASALASAADARERWRSAPPPTAGSAATVTPAPATAVGASEPARGRPERPAVTTGALSLAALVVGGGALLVSGLPLIGLLAGLAALGGLTLGIVALATHARRTGLAITGTALSGAAFVVATALSLVWLGLWQATTDEQISSEVRHQVAKQLGGSDGSDLSDGPSDGSGDGSDGGLGDGSDDGADDVVAFGDSSIYDSGVEIAVSAPVSWTPPATASRSEQGSTVIFTVTVRNGSGRPFSPLVSTEVWSGTEGTPGTAVSDPTTGIGMPTFDTIPVDGTASFRLAYSVADPDMLEVDVAPDGDDDWSVFASPLENVAEGS